LDLEENDFVVGSLLESAESLLAVRSRDKMLTLKLSVAENLPTVARGDANRLLQILLNLGYNAVKFTDQGGITIRVDVQEQTTDEVTLHFIVSDTGIGVPPEKLGSVFDRFSQADSSITRKYGGSGLGLAISSQIVDKMGGKIWVDSEVGKGSAFHFTVRFRRAESAEITDLKNTKQPKAGVELIGMKVLLVEDNLFNQAVAVEVLKKRGCELTVASNGKEAVEAFDSQPFDVILMDLQMPEMDGFEATRIIRSRETFGRIPIIAQTAHAFKEDRIRCMEAGMDEHIPKPIEIDELVTALERIHHSQRGGGSQRVRQ
jgi:CheY-like chemotaxis protein